MEIRQLINEYQSTVDETINLIASENIFCRDARLPYMSDIIHRYSFDGDSVDFVFPGRDIITKIEERTCNLLKEMLDAKYVNVKPISGLNCMLSLVGTLTNKGDTIYSMPLNGGGHGATQPLAERLALNHKFLPFNENSMQIDFEELERQLSEDNKVKMVYIDLMNVLFPVDIKRLKEVVPRSTMIVYDASHVMGFILGKQFQNPLKEGADFLIGSTHKTLPGPHKGIIATNKTLLARKFDLLWPLFISHHHTGDVASLGIVVEKYKDTFETYSKETIKNAKTMAKCLYEGGIKVQCEELGFTESHQIWIDVGSDDCTFEAIKKLAQFKIVANALKLPTLGDRYGIRFGVQEITFKGYKEDDVKKLSHILLDIILDRRGEEEIKKSLAVLNSKKYDSFCDI